MKDEFLVTLLTSSGEKICLQRFRNVVTCFNKVLKECGIETIVKTQCWNLRGASARNNADDVRDSLENSDLVICVIDPTATEGVRDDVIQALDWVRESFQMSFFAVKERSMFIYVKETSSSGTGSRQTQRALSFLETLYKKGYYPITYPSENAFALTLLYQICNMVRSELWCCDFPKDNGFGLGDMFTANGIAEFGINFHDLHWVKNCKEHRDLRTEIEQQRKALSNGVDKYSTALRIEQAKLIKEKMEYQMLQCYCLMCRFFCRQNTPEMTQAISAFLLGDLALANKKLNTAQLVRRISAYRKNPEGLKSAGATYKMEFDYLLNCYLLKIHLLLFSDPLSQTDTEAELYGDVLSLSQGLVTLLEQMGINDESGGFFYLRSEIAQAKAQFSSSARMFEAFPREKQKKVSLLGINAYHYTARCLEKELGEVKMVEGENLPKKTISALKAVRVLYHKSLSLITPLLKRYPNSYWPVFDSIYADLYGFYTSTGQIARADKLSEETHAMVSKLSATNKCVEETLTGDNQENYSVNNVNNEGIGQGIRISGNTGKDRSHKGCDFAKILDKTECHVELANNNLERAQKRIPQGLGTYIKSISKDPYKVEEDLFAWIDSEEALPDIFSILKGSNGEYDNAKESKEDQMETLETESSPMESDPLIPSLELEDDSNTNWDIAQILLDQATIYSKKENYIHTIRYAAAALESINHRLVKNPALITMVFKALEELMNGYTHLKMIPEFTECKLQYFYLLLPNFKRGKAKSFDVFNEWLNYSFLQLHQLNEDNLIKISHNLFFTIREFMVDNYADPHPSKVLNMLKTMRYSYIHYIKVAGPELIQKIDLEIAHVENICNHTKNNGLFGSDI